MSPDKSKWVESLLYKVMFDNVVLGRYADEEGNLNCNVCKCPLVMHKRGLGCGVARDCKNPKCEVTKKANEKSHERISRVNREFYAREYDKCFGTAPRSDE